MPCPVCGGGNLVAAVLAAAVEREIHERKEFVFSRLGRRAAPAELKDLVDFMHGGVAPLARCAGCGLLAREESSKASYEEDPNDPDLMAHLYPRYVDFFRRKEAAFRDRLGAGASVIEVGPHLGGFLQVAEEWNWRPVGLDIGRDTSQFARHRGLTVRRETLEDTKLPASSADALFFWNCFEQLAGPAAALDRAYRLLRPWGLLVLRVPNADFYLAHRASDPQWLAWNNLLAFPYLYGYNARTLNRVAARHGFEPVRGYDSELLTMPFADLNARLAAEQLAVSREVSAAVSGTLTGPWLEIVYRKMDEVRRRQARVDCRFLERSA